MLLYEICLARKKGTGQREEEPTIGTHMNADCLLKKNTSTKHNKYVVNQKLEHCDDISCRELFCRIRVLFLCCFFWCKIRLYVIRLLIFSNGILNFRNLNTENAHQCSMSTWPEDN